MKKKYNKEEIIKLGEKVFNHIIENKEVPKHVQLDENPSINITQYLYLVTSMIVNKYDNTFSYINMTKNQPFENIFTFNENINFYDIIKTSKRIYNKLDAIYSIGTITIKDKPINFADYILLISYASSRINLNEKNYDKTISPHTYLQILNKDKNTKKDEIVTNQMINNQTKETNNINNEKTILSYLNPFNWF